MKRSLLVMVPLVGVAAATSFFLSRPAFENAPEGAERMPVKASSPKGFSAVETRADRSAQESFLERRVKSLEARLAEEAAERKRLEEQVDTLSTRLAALDGSSSRTAAPAAAPAVDPQPAPEPIHPSAPAIDYTKSAMERALVTAGLDTATAADIKRGQDELVMAEMVLRDQATRESWIDTPRFNEEMAAIEARKTSLRDELGDDTYDRYLYALGQTNRIRVDDVLLQSPAAQVGLQTGDMILSYGDARLFAPGDLVAETRSGNAGEAVRLQILRNGQRLEVEVPRGPLGLRLAATQYNPEES